MADYALMNQALFEGRQDGVRQMTEEALAEGRPAMEVLEDGLIGGMRVVGEDFKHNRIFVPEVLLAARAMKAGLAVLNYVEAAMVPFGKTLHGRLAEIVRGRGRVYSFGFSGAPLSQYLAWASWVKKTFHPSLLVVTIIGNDFDESLLQYKNAPGYHFFDDSREGMPLVRVDTARGIFPSVVRLSGVSALARYVRQNLGLSRIVQRLHFPSDVQYAGNVPMNVEADRIERSKRVIDVFLERLPGMPVFQLTGLF